MSQAGDITKEGIDRLQEQATNWMTAHERLILSETYDVDPTVGARYAQETLEVIVHGEDEARKRRSRRAKAQGGDSRGL